MQEKVEIIKILTKALFLSKNWPNNLPFIRIVYLAGRSMDCTFLNILSYRKLEYRKHVDFSFSE